MNTLDSLFAWFVSATLRASALAVAVLILQMLLRRRLPARWRYALWLPVVVVLVAPRLPESRWSVENYLPVREPAAEMQLVVTRPSAGEPAPVTPSVGAALRTNFSWKQLAAGTWIAGVVVLLSAGVFSYLRTMRRMRRSEVLASAELRELLEESARACGLSRVPRVLISEAISSPAVTGLWRSLLLLPAEVQTEYTAGEVRLILRHEFTHLRRHDVAANWLLCALQALHWCNPVLWFAFARMRGDREVACDEQVLATQNAEQRMGYGEVLLKLASAPPVSGFSVGWVGIFGPAASMRTRILAIAGYRRRSSGWGWLSLAAMSALAIAGATRAQEAAGSAVKAPAGRQVLIDAHFYSIPHNPDVPLNINADFINTQRGGLSIAVQKPADFQALTTDFVRKHKATVLASPRLVTRDGQLAKILVGEEGPEAPEKKGQDERPFVGISLSITPQTTPQGLRLVIASALSTATDAVTNQPVNAPIADWSRVVTHTRRMTAPVMVQPGQSVVLYQASVSGDAKEKGPAVALTITPTVVDAVSGAPGNGQPKPAKDDGAKPQDPKKAAKALQDKAEAIKLPKVELRDATLEEAADYLSAASVGLDPDKKGIKIVVAAGENDMRITLSLSDVPLLEALKYVTNLAGTKYRFEAERVVIVPMGGK